tara:strand:+ start:1382 stop:1717 length:336 start_codon:yes stop_codon:yes gene_type:complete
MAIANALIDGDTTLLTVPANKRYAITNILICNNEDTNLVHEEHGITDFDMHLVKTGDPVSLTNMILSTVQMPAGETFSLDEERIILEGGDRVVISGSSPTVLSATVSYMEV